MTTWRTCRTAPTRRPRKFRRSRAETWAWFRGVRSSASGCTRSSSRPDRRWETTQDRCSTACSLWSKSKAVHVLLPTVLYTQASSEFILRRDFCNDCINHCYTLFWPLNWASINVFGFFLNFSIPFWGYITFLRTLVAICYKGTFPRTQFILRRWKISLHLHKISRLVRKLSNCIKLIWS